MPARVLQVGYDPGLVRVRELALAQSGFSVVSVLGNPEACRKLAETAPFDVFLIGWSTAYEDRKAIVGWMKERWPKIPVIAIHDTFRSPIPGADIAATHDTPEEWISAVERAARLIGEPDVS